MSSGRWGGWHRIIGLHCVQVSKDSRKIVPFGGSNVLGNMYYCIHSNIWAALKETKSKETGVKYAALVNTKNIKLQRYTG